MLFYIFHKFCNTKCNEEHNKLNTNCLSTCLKKTGDINLFLDKEINLLKSKRFDIYNYTMDI